jgi:hypothetical protein
MFLSAVWLPVLGAVGVYAASSLDPRWKLDSRWKTDPTPTVDKSRFVSTNGPNFKVNNRFTALSISPHYVVSDLISTVTLSSLAQMLTGFRPSIQVNGALVLTNFLNDTNMRVDEDIDAVLGNISQANITVVRTWAFNGWSKLRFYMQ